MMENGVVQYEWRGKDGGLAAMMAKLEERYKALDGAVKRVEAATDRAFTKAVKGSNLSITATNKLGAAFTKAQAPVDKLGLKLADMPGKIQAIEREADRLRDKLRSATNINDIARYNQQLELTKKRLAEMHGVGLNAKAQRPGMSFGNAASSFMGQMPGGLGMVAGLATNPYLLGGAAVAGVGMYTNKAIDEYLSFDKLISKANVTARLDKAGRDKLKAELLGINYIGGPLTDVPIAFNQAISSTGDVNRSLDIVKTAVKGSKAGFADLPTVTAALTSASNQLQATGAKASSADILDVFIKAQRLGAVEFGQLSNDLPGLMAVRPKGTNYKDVAGAYSYLSTVLPIQEANTDLLNLLNALNKPEAKERFKKERVALFGAKGEAIGFLKVLDNIYTRYKTFKTDKGAETFLGNLIPDSQAAAGLKSIFADYEKFSNIVKDMQNAAGETDIALKFSISDQDIVDQAKQSWDIFSQAWGKFSAPLKIGVALQGAQLLSNPSRAIQNPFDIQFNTVKSVFNSIFGLSTSGDRRQKGQGYDPKTKKYRMPDKNETIDKYGIIHKQDYSKWDYSNWDKLNFRGSKTNTSDEPNATKKDGTATAPGGNDPDSSTVTNGTRTLKSVVVNIGVIKAADSINTVVKNGEVKDLDGTFTDLIVRDIYNAETILSR